MKIGNLNSKSRQYINQRRIISIISDQKYSSTTIPSDSVNSTHTYIHIHTHKHTHIHTYTYTHLDDPGKAVDYDRAQFAEL